MQTLKSILFSIILIGLFITSCNSVAPAMNSNNIPSATTNPTSTYTTTPVSTLTTIPTFTFTAESTITLTMPPTDTPTITKTPVIPPSVTPLPANQPALISIMGNRTNKRESRIAFSPDGLILAQANSSVKLWDVNTYELIRILSIPHKGESTNILFSPDGNYLAVSIPNEDMGAVSTGHLLVWNVATGELVQDWVQEPAIMSTYNGYNPEPSVYTIPVDAMVFFPSSTRLAYANGNNIEIKDVQGIEESRSWSLGDKMYASDLGISSDSKDLYIFMRWFKHITFPSLWKWRFRVEIWDTDTGSFLKEIKFEEIDIDDADKWLVGQYLVQRDNINYKLDALDLSTDINQSLPYRLGIKYFNEDASFMLVVHAGYLIDDSDESVEIWNTDNWRNPYSFKPDFMEYLALIDDVVLSPDKTILAIDYDGKISLWDTSLLAQP